MITRPVTGKKETVVTEWVRPDYLGGGIVNLMSSIIKGRGGEIGEYPPLADVSPEPFDLARNVVLLVIDGLGYDYLQAAGGVLAQHVVRSLTSVAPPTTATAVTTFLTGTAPQQHGLTGWFVHFREVASVLAVLPFQPRLGGAALGQQGISAQQLLGHVPIFDRMPVQSYSVSPAWIADSEFNRAHLGRAALVPFQNYDDLIAQINRVVLSHDRRKYVYAYWAGFDGLAHEHGIGSHPVAEHFKRIDQGVARLVESLAGSDTLLMVTADHGFVDIAPENRIDINQHPQLLQMLSLPLCGEPRMAYCYVRAAQARNFESYVNEHLGYAVVLFPSEQILDEGWLGLGQPHPELLARLGDYVLIAKEGFALVQRLPHETPLRHIGFHGGVSRAEMRVPLVMMQL